MAVQGSFAYQSGAWEIDLARRELRLGGQPVPLGGRAFDIVEVLIESAGELVTKDDLMSHVWPDVTVGDNTLQVHVWAVRKALGADRWMLKTTTGRGYRLLGDWWGRQESAAAVTVAPARTQVRPQTNLPADGADLIGREAALQQLRDLVSAYRIVTLAGPGGIGKTTLVLKVARRVLGEFADGGWLVELASLSDPGLVLSTVAQVLRLGLGGGDITAEIVARTIGDRHLLLVLDNCEHLIDAVAILAEMLLRLCPRVTILMTSREVLRIQGEYVYRVPPLVVPAPGEREASDILRHSAPELFIARAKELGSDFSSNATNLATISAICRHLDGIPLAIEFAAARAAALGIELVAAGLRDRLALLTSGRRTALPRHRTLRAALDWSYELLSEEERRLLRCLAVFPAGFTLDAAVALMDEAGSNNLSVMDGVTELVTKSLVTLDGTEGGSRWLLLETIRAYALQKVTECGEIEGVQRRHAIYFRDLFAPPSDGAPSLSHEEMARCIREIDNVRAALDWAFTDAGDSEVGAALTAAYVPVWLYFAWYTECRERTSRALAAAGAKLDIPTRMWLLSGLGMTEYYMMGAPDRTSVLLTEAFDIAVSLDDADAQLRTLWGLWVLHHDTGDCRAARGSAERFADVARRTNDATDALVADRLLGYTIQFGGDLHDAQRRIERVINLYDVRMDRRHRIWFLHDQRVAAHDLLARSLWLQGFADQAAEHARACLEEAEATENFVSICEAIRLAVGPIALATGDLVTAERAVATLLAHTTRHISTYWTIARLCLEGELLIRRGTGAEGVALLSEALGYSEKTGWAVSYPAYQGVLAEGLAGLGHLSEAHAAVERALAAADRGGELWSLAELLRIKGALLLGSDGSVPSEAAAEECFTQALGIARGQGALFWELRSATSLAGLHVRQGRSSDARQVLAGVYDRFTEGFQTPDLRAARAMLESLPAGGP